MASISSPSAHSTTIHRRDDSSREGAVDLVCPLVFSLVGLLTDGLALLVQGEASLAPLRFALIACAAPIAAMVALWFVGDADEIVS